MSLPPDPARFDEEALAELVEDMGESLPDLVQGFLSSLDEAGICMRETAARGEPAGIAPVAHRLKSTAGYLGAEGMVAALQALQDLGHDGADAPGIEAALAEFDRAATAVRERLARL